MPEEKEIPGWERFDASYTKNVHAVWRKHPNKDFKHLIGVQDERCTGYSDYPIRAIYIVQRNKKKNLFYLAVKSYMSAYEENGTQWWYLPGYRFTSLEAAATAYRFLPNTISARTELPK
jgi:hypothetical protein